MSEYTRQCEPVTNRFHIPGTDLVVQIELKNNELSMTVKKAQSNVYRVILEQATESIENPWLAEMFMRDDRVQLGKLSADMVDYIDSLNIAQG